MCLFSAATCSAYVTMQIRSLRANARLQERKFHCDVHVAAENKGGWREIERGGGPHFM